MGVGMIVTTGRIIKAETVGFRLERSSEVPGLVTVYRDSHESQIDLPGNKEDAERFIAAYRRVLEEDVGYRRREAE